MTAVRADVSLAGARPQISDRVWVAIATVGESCVEVRGILSQWAGQADWAQILVSDRAGPRAWAYVQAPVMDDADEMDAAIRRAYMSSTPYDAPDANVVRQSAPSISVVVCTRDRAPQLDDCLKRLALLPSDVEIVVVDNAPRTSATKEVVARYEPRVRRVVEGRPGLSVARNAGLREASGDVIAFTDDDALVEPDWTERIQQGFCRADDVAVVTGLVAPAAILDQIHATFEKRVKWSAMLQPEVYRMAERDRYSWPFPYAAGNFGTGANFAVRRDIAAAIGGFDEALGAGTKVHSGEDAKFFIQSVRAGHSLVYEPAAVVWHQHRGDAKSLHRQVRGYGSGMAAVFTSLALEPGRVEMAAGVARGARALASRRRDEAGYGVDRSYTLAELQGVAVGPISYAVERVRRRRRS